MKNVSNFQKIMLAILQQLLYNTPVTPVGVMELGSDPSAASGGVKRGERVAAVGR